MLYLLFRVANERFCLDVSQIVEVAPIVDIKSIPHAPEGVLGFINYRGIVSPLIDLSILLAGKPSKHLMSSRIIIANFSSPNGVARPAGLLAEMVTETISRKREDLQPSNMKVENAPYLGDVFFDEEGMIQVIKLDRIFPDSLKATLFPATIPGGDAAG